MTRVLFWNIQTFGINKIFNTSRKRKRNNGGLTPQQAAAERRAVVGRVLRAAQPDIIVVIEVGSGNNPNGSLATQTDGMAGCVLLQGALNNTPALNAGGWNQVPPLHVGQGGRTETVGVFYRRQTGTTNRYFTGPNIWALGGYNGSSVNPTFPLPAPIAVAYPAGMGGQVDINAMLVPAGAMPRNIPAAAQHNGGVAENRVAARTEFAVNAAGAAGANVNFGNLRAPYMVTFTETNAAGAVQRNLSLFAIHAPPQGVAAANYMTTLGTLWDIARPLGVNETRVIGGDFNRNLLAVNGAPSNAYAALTAGGNNYRLLLNPTTAGAPTNLDQYQGFYSTHIRGALTTAASRFMWSDPNTNQSFYPGYGYVGSNFVAAPFYAIDNILVWPFRAAPHNYQTTILNPVVGTPFNAAGGGLPNNPPQGTLAMAHALQNPPAAGWPQAPAANNYPGIGAARNLVSWVNYGHIKSTSDHFAVHATV